MMRRRRFASVLATSVSAWPAVALSRARAANLPTASRAVAPVYFGMHFHRLVRKPGEPAPTPWPAQVTIGALRLWDCDTRWADLAPHPGRWDFDRMDAYVERATAHGASILYTLGSTPRWASARPDEPGPYGPGCAAEPLRISDWVDYLRRVVGRYRGVVGAYELWNEPNFADIARDRGAPGFFTGSVAAMLEMARAARRVIDEIDPQARLATPGFVNGSDRLALFLRAGGAGLVDAVAYHLYAPDTDRFVGQLAELHQVMRECSVSALPLWNTECGVEARSADPPHESADPAARSEPDAAAVMTQFLLLGASAGVARFDYYAWDNGRTGMIDSQGQGRPRLGAFAQVQSWMLGVRFSAAEPLPGGVVRIGGDRGGERFVFAWARRDGNLRLTLPAGWRAEEVERLFDAPLPAPAPVAKEGASLVLALPVSLRPMRLRLVAIEGTRSVSRR